MRPSSPMQSGALTEALSDENFISDYYINNAYEEELLENLYEDGFSPYELCASN